MWRGEAKNTSENLADLFHRGRIHGVIGKKASRISPKCFHLLY